MTGTECYAFVIVGGGCSGTLVAVNLFRHGLGGRVAIVEPREQLGAGLAYSTTFDQHLLNVPAGKMSALPAEPAHFLNWLRSGPMPGATPECFAPRKLYGQYVNRMAREYADRIDHIRAEAIGAARDGEGIAVQLAHGEAVRAAAAVLALGNPASCSHPATVECNDRWHASPWLGDALRVRFPGERILIIGSGLTAVDAVLALHSQDKGCRTIMLSRRSILPHVHNVRLPAHPTPEFQHRGSLRRMFRELRSRIAEARDADLCWRVVVDSLRPVSNDLWRELPTRDQEFFLRHLRTFWETHRHRMAPEIRGRLTACQESGELELVAGRLEEATCEESGVACRIRLRNAGERAVMVDRLITCTGIHEDYRKSPRPLVQSLMRQGMAAPNALGTGLATDPHGALLEAGGAVSDVLYTLGPPRRGDLFETTAMPEIRVQAEALARTLLQSRAS